MQETNPLRATGSFSPQVIFGTSSEPTHRLEPTNRAGTETCSSRALGITGDAGVSTPENFVECCGPMDILAGRAGRRKDNILGKEHPGTKIFDETISRNLPAYQDRSHRNQRSHLIKEVVGDLLSQGCRFVKYNSKVNKFVVLNEKQIRDKVSFAFRHQSMKQGFTREQPKKTIKRTMMNMQLNSPRSVTASPFSIEADLKVPFLLEPSSELRQQPTLSPIHVCCDIFGNDHSRKHSEISPRVDDDVDDGDDDREFIGMIDDLDVDGLMLTEEEVDMTFDIDYELTRHDTRLWGVVAPQ